MKHRNQRKLSQMKFIFTGLLLLFLTAATSVPVFAASKKAVQVKCSFNALVEDQTVDEWDKNTYAVQALLSGTHKLVKPLTYSARVIIPKTLLKPNGDNIGVIMDLNLFKSQGKKEPSYEGMTSGRYWFFVECREGKASLSVYDQVKEKNPETTKYASVRESGGNYVLTIKNAPFQETYFDVEGKQFSPKTKYTLAPTVVINGNFEKDTSGYIYVDEFSVKVKDTHKITFEKKNYEKLAVYCFYKNKKQKTKLVSVK